MALPRTRSLDLTVIGGFHPPQSGPPHYESIPGHMPSQNRGIEQHRSDTWGPNNGVPWVPSIGPPPNMGPQPFEYQPPSGPLHMPPSQTQYFDLQAESPSGEEEVQLNFKYSQCTARKKALLIGINYTGSRWELDGAQNDARNIKKFLERKSYLDSRSSFIWYKPDDFVMLTDDPSRRPDEQPTRANIIKAMNWLVYHAEPDDSLFLHFSGHGGLTPDIDGDEPGGFDQVIFPVDIDLFPTRVEGQIVDDEMHDILVKPLPAGCRLTAIFDCCHSGSLLDLPYVYSTEGKVKEPKVPKLPHLASRQQLAQEFSRQTKSSPADVIMWSSCKDSQSAADTQIQGEATGAMSWAFMKALRENPMQSYQELLINIRKMLKSQYSQRPQLSSSHPMDTSILFIA
ncbi:Ca(2+)-dependent cysteine protease [Tulasnella sp. 331]|nr:Ca(2+)-dependent cysteine protease [Tulasnella sp. 331]